jgi:hypothetical protein
MTWTAINMALVGEVERGDDLRGEALVSIPRLILAF